MISVLAYMLCVFDGALLSNSITMAVGWYAVVHLIFVRWIFGWGAVPDIDADIFYTLIVLLVAVTGRGVACMLHVAPNGWTRRIMISPGKYEPVVPHIIRLVKALLVVGATFGASAAFEYLPKSLVFGIALTAVLCLLKCGAFYFLFRVFTTRSGMPCLPGCDWHVLVYDAAFITPDGCGSSKINLPLRLTVAMIVADMLMVIIYGVLFYTTLMWQIGIGLIAWGVVAGAVLIVYSVLRGIEDSRHAAKQEIPARGYCTPPAPQRYMRCAHH